MLYEKVCPAEIEGMRARLHKAYPSNTIDRYEAIVRVLDNDGCQFYIIDHWCAEYLVVCRPEDKDATDVCGFYFAPILWCDCHENITYIELRAKIIEIMDKQIRDWRKYQTNNAISLCICECEYNPTAYPLIRALI